MKTSQTLCRIDVGRQPYFLQTRIIDGGNDSFELWMTDAVNSWAGKISTGMLGQLATKVDMEVDDYLEQTTKALTRQDMADMTFEYQMKGDASGTMEFSWKKVMAGQIKFQLGTLTLHIMEDSAETIQDLFIFTIENAGQLAQEINGLRRENERISQERSDALKRLEKCVVMHEEMERELFSKFVVVLNDKKAKIRSLKQEVKDIQLSLDTAQKAGVPHATQSSGDESDDDLMQMDTDEASTDDENTSKRVTKRVVASRKHDSSLMLDDEEPIRDKQIVGKRKRREVTAKQTPSKLSIPKGASFKSERSATPGTSQGRLSRTPSNHSSKSDPDVDMLFEEL